MRYPDSKFKVLFHPFFFIFWYQWRSKTLQNSWRFHLASPDLPSSAQLRSKTTFKFCPFDSFKFPDIVRYLDKVICHADWSNQEIHVTYRRIGLLQRSSYFCVHPTTFLINGCYWNDQRHMPIRIMKPLWTKNILSCILGGSWLKNWVN